MGDNADGAKSQNLNDPLGKLLRFNDDGSIPSDNPFCNASTGLATCAIWAYGLRNPFTFAVQPGSGRIHINDVGQNTWEEINLGAAGANYGWSASEGPDNIGAGVTRRSSPTNTAPRLPPARAQAASSPVFQSPAAPSIRAVVRMPCFPPSSAATTSSPISSAVSSACSTSPNGNAAYSFASLAGNPVDMLVGLDGALYVLTRSAITRISAP